MYGVESRQRLSTREPCLPCPLVLLALFQGGHTFAVCHVAWIERLPPAKSAKET